MPAAKPSKPQSPGELFPIRTVSSLTGVNVITLRAWERRYGLIKPVRTPTGHRLYRREDIDRIHSAVALLDKGIAISQVKNSLDHATPHAAPGAGSTWARYRARMVSAIARFDEDALEQTYNEALGVHTIEQVTQELLIPLLKELGRRWESGDGSVAEEHFFGVYLRNKLGARFHHRANSNTGARLLAACLPGEQHEVGLLLFALTAHDSGLRPILLGANMPLDELPTAVKRADCRAVVLSGSITPEAQVLAEQLAALVAAAGVPVFVGGMTSVRERDAIISAGSVPLGSDLSSGVKRIRSTLSYEQFRK